MSRKRTFQTIKTEGGLLPADLLQRLAAGDNIEGLKPETYHLAPTEKLGEAASRSWNRLVGIWKHFREELESKDEGAHTGLTRERWLLPLFQELGYGQLQPAKGGLTVDEKQYSISHLWSNSPIHLLGASVPLDRRSKRVAGASQAAPHSLVQEFLNRSDDHLWAFVSNGLTLRILRDNLTLTRQAYVEFDLESMFDGEVYSDFVLLWLLCHQSRVEIAIEDPPTACWLEKWTTFAHEEGTRALEKLRTQVETAIEALGAGFLAHPANTDLREKLRAGELTTQDYYKEVLRTVYRLLFLFVAEDRGALLHPDADPTATQRYHDHFSTSRLRSIAERRRGGVHHDLWECLKLVFRALGQDEGCPTLGLPCLGSFLWSDKATPHLDAAAIANRDLLKAIYTLAFAIDEKVRRPIDYKNLGSEELGSVYESLLELHPRIHLEAATFELGSAAGHERKTSGSYYTPDSLVQCLLDSALEPVIKARLAEAKTADEKEAALLDLKVCDPAVGSGHFLIAAAHRISKHLAAARTGEDEPSPADYQHALREVVGRCLYGVDVNPMAVELCKVSLWIEAIEPGKPLSFLDHHIRCGNSLLGTTPEAVASGIPDDAFKPTEGDDKDACSELRKRNKRERAGFGELFTREDTRVMEALREAAGAIDEIPDDNPEAIREKEKAFKTAQTDYDYLARKTLFNCWCSAFMLPKQLVNGSAAATGITQQTLNNLASGSTIPEELAALIKLIPIKYQLFHWSVEFPEVFSPPLSENGQRPRDGFDCVLGNPPWEKINLKDEEYFAGSHPEIANASSKAARKKLIANLQLAFPDDYRKYREAQDAHDKVSLFFRSSGNFPFTGVSRINLYSVFAELSTRLVGNRGRVGLVIASGIATDDNNKALFKYLTRNGQLVSVYDFENREGIFPDVHRMYRFCLFCAQGNGHSTPAADFTFGLTNPGQLSDPSRHFRLSASQLVSLNPTSGTCPAFRSAPEATLTTSIYEHVSNWAAHSATAHWPGIPKTPFNMANDSDLFIALGTETARPELGLLPLYESKLIHQFSHRYASFTSAEREDPQELSSDQLSDPTCVVISRYLLPQSLLGQRFRGNWFFTYRMITNAGNERTAIASVIPQYPCGHSLSILENISAQNALLLVSNINSFAYDYCARQKVAGSNFSHWIWKQLPIVSPSQYTEDDSSPLEQVVRHGLELTFTAWDMEPFAQDCGYDGPPFRWDEKRRFQLRCELDSLFFHLYLPCDDSGEWKLARIADGAVRDETDEELATLESHFPNPREAVSYIMDTFPIVKRKDEAAHGTYRTKDRILEIYDEMLQARRENQEWKSPLDPPPGPPTDAEGNFLPFESWKDNRPSHIHPPREET